MGEINEKCTGKKTFLKHRICFQSNLLNHLGRASEHKQSAFLFHVKWRDSISPHHRFHQLMQQRTELMYMYKGGNKTRPVHSITFTPSLYPPRKKTIQFTNNLHNKEPQQKQLVMPTGSKGTRRLINSGGVRLYLLIR